MRIDSIQGRMSLLFFAFAGLVVVSVGVTFWGITTQRQDALIVNLAGRQRMLVQQMTRLAFEIKHGAGADVRLELQEAMNTFERTLFAFQEGGPAPYLVGYSVALPATNDPAVQTQLSQLSQEWGPFRENLQSVLRSEPDSQGFQNAIQNIERDASALVQGADLVVRGYEQVATNKVGRIIWIQISFFISALFLLGLGSVMTKRSVVDQLGKLGEIAERIGEGKLEQPVIVTGPTEIQALSLAFENMRVQLLSSRQEILGWTATLEERVMQRTLELEAFQEVSREISSHLDIRRVLGSVTEKSRQLLNGEAAFLCLLDNDEQFLNLQATSGPEEAVIHLSSYARASLQGQVLSAEHALLCGVQDCQGACGMMAIPYRTSHVAAPLRAGNRVIGALCVGNSNNSSFSDKDRELLTWLADAAAIALENARLYEKAERTAILEERQILAAEMHDGLTQTVSFVHLMVDLACEQVERERRRIRLCDSGARQVGFRSGFYQARQIIANLQDDLPRRSSLQNQLASVIGECSQDGIEIEWINELRSPVMMSSQDSLNRSRVSFERRFERRKTQPGIAYQRSFETG